MSGEYQQPNNKFYLNNPYLFKPGVKHNYTVEQIQELEKCSKDIKYFAEKYFYIVHIDKGKIKIPLYEFQKELLDLMVDNRWVTVKMCRQASKCVSINTNVTVRNKLTGEIQQLTLGELYEIARDQNSSSL